MSGVSSATLPLRLARKRFSPTSTTIAQDADVLLRYKHTNRYQISPATFDAALAMCQLQARLQGDMNGAHRPSKRRNTTLTPSAGPISSSIAPPLSSYAARPLSSPSACRAERPSRYAPDIQRNHTRISSEYGSQRITATTRFSETMDRTPLIGVSECPTIKISLKSLEKLRQSLHRPPAAYRMIDPDYGTKKRKRD